MAEESKRDLTSQSMKFDKIQIKLASPEDILEWSHGENQLQNFKTGKRWFVL